MLTKTAIEPTKQALSYIFPSSPCTDTPDWEAIEKIQVNLTFQAWRIFRTTRYFLKQLITFKYAREILRGTTDCTQRILSEGQLLGFSGRDKS